MPKNSRTFEDICNQKSGYVLDTGVTIEDMTIKKATKKVSEKIDKLMEDFEMKSKREVTKFYIGKSYIRKRKRQSFHKKTPDTWKLDHGINGRYSEHVRTAYGEDGLLVVAVVTASSIPEDCKDEGYITHQEEYALTLERRLIQQYKKEDDRRLANKGTDPGKTDVTKSIGYVVYIAFKSEEVADDDDDDSDSEED